MTFNTVLGIYTLNLISFTLFTMFYPHYTIRHFFRVCVSVIFPSELNFTENRPLTSSVTFFMLCVYITPVCM